MTSSFVYKTVFPSKLNALHRHGASDVKTFFSRPVWTSQMRTVPSADADTNEVVSQFTSMVHTVPLCPLYEPKCSPLIEYHTEGTLSLPDENNKSPSRLYRICVNERS